jgi:hypothetical protein
VSGSCSRRPCTTARTTRGTPTAFRVIEPDDRVSPADAARARRWSVGRFVLFLSQWVLVTPLIRRAAAYERIDPVRAASHADASREPGEGLERVACTQALFWLVLGAVGGWMHTRALEKHVAYLERPS